MICSIYLHNEIAEILKSFGELSEVVNKILQEGANGSFDFMDKPNIQSRDGAKRYEINVQQEDYLNLLKCFPINSPKISLRRLLYWFVENEIYVDLNWKQCNYYKNIKTQKIIKIIEIIKSDVTKLNILLPTEFTNKNYDIMSILKQLEEHFKNELQYNYNDVNQNS